MIVASSNPKKLDEYQKLFPTIKTKLIQVLLSEEPKAP